MVRPSRSHYYTCAHIGNRYFLYSEGPTKHLPPYREVVKYRFELIQILVVFNASAEIAVDIYIDIYMVM